VPRVPKVPKVPKVRLVLAAACLAIHADAAAAIAERSFRVDEPGEVIASFIVECGACAWEVEGREAVVLIVTLDDQRSRQVPIVAGTGVQYRVAVGAVQPGTHLLRIDEDANLTARALRGHNAAFVRSIQIEQLHSSSPEYEPLSLAPIVYARPNTVGRFTDVPVFIWYEREATPRGTRYRYSVIFTNEDGGTPADRLMATWGRTTDIEYVYGVEVNRDGSITNEEIQGPKHEMLPFRGTREARHPLLWVTTDNNMVEDHGTTTVRYAPAPVAFPLQNISREEVMDANPWLYELAAKELTREGKIVEEALPGKGIIQDPRRFIYIEGCGDVGAAALAFGVRVKDTWIPSDRGIPEYRIVRDGCFRAAIPLPLSASELDIRALRAQAYERPDQKAHGTSSPVHLMRINKVFTLDDRYRPGKSLMQWEGEQTLIPGGSPVEFPIR
jgi:hypothetical protein